MAAPSLPTLATITTEGLKKAGYSSPSLSKLSRAQDEWMEEIKNDIFSILKDPIMTMTTGLIILSEGVQQYSFPTDYSYLETAKLLYGEQTGTAQAGGGTDLTLAAASTFTEDWIKGKNIVITSGTGSYQERMCRAYDTATKIATVPVWTTTPDSTSVYMIIDTEKPLEIGHVAQFDRELYPMNKSQPNKIYPVGDEDNGEFYVLENPDKTYVIRLRYYVDLAEVDLDSTLMSTLYKRWRNVWTQGIKAKAYDNDDDDRAQMAMSEYRSMVSGLLMREKYGMSLSELAATVE